MFSKTQITCPKCGEKYYLIAEDYPMRDKDKLPCDKCGYILKEWNGGVIYSLEKILKQEQKYINS